MLYTWNVARTFCDVHSKAVVAVRILDVKSVSIPQTSSDVPIQQKNSCVYTVFTAFQRS